MTKVQTIKQIIDSSGGKICSVIFIKKSNGKVRHMVFRKGVSKGVSGRGLRYNPSSVGNVVVFDMGSNGFRTIKLNNVMSLKVNGVTHNFGDR